MLAEGTIEMGASAKALGIAGGNMILTNPVSVNRFLIGFTDAITEGSSPNSENMMYKHGRWGYLTGSILQRIKSFQGE